MTILVKAFVEVLVNMLVKNDECVGEHVSRFVGEIVMVKLMDKMQVKFSW